MINVGNGRDTIRFLLSDPCPYIIRDINGTVVFDILQEVNKEGLSEHNTFRNEFVVFGGHLDDLLKCPNYRDDEKPNLRQRCRNVWYRWKLKWMMFRLRSEARQRR